MIFKRENYVSFILVFFSLCFTTFCMAKKSSSQDQAQLHLMPWPARMTVESGMLRLGSGFKVVWNGHQEPRLLRAVARFGQHFRELTAIPPSPIEQDEAVFSLEIHCDGPGEDVQSIREEESYTLRVSSSGVVLKAPTPAEYSEGLRHFPSSSTRTMMVRICRQSGYRMSPVFHGGDC